MPGKQTTIEKRGMKVYFNPEMEDMPFPQPMSYKLLVEAPKELEDINKTEGTKLTGIESGAMNLTYHNSDELPQGSTNKYLLDFSVTNQKLAAAAVEWEKIANEAVKSNNIWTGGNVITLSAQIKEGIILNVHIGNAEIQAAKIASLNADVINAGIMTGRKVRTAASGDRISMEIGEGAYPHNLLFYTSDILRGMIKSGGAGLGLNLYAPQAGDGIFLGTGSGLHLVIGNDWITSYKSIAFTGDQTVDGVDISAFATAFNNLVSNYNSHITEPSAHHSQYSSGINITPNQVVTSGLIQGGSLNITGTGAHYIQGPLYLCSNKITLGAGGGYDILPYGDVYGQIGYSNRRWDKIYCVTLTQGDLHFENPKTGEILFKIKEDPGYLNFYNKKGQLIMKLSQEGGLYTRSKIEDNLLTKL